MSIVSVQTPELDVKTSEYRRLLGMPPDYDPPRRVKELEQWARRWYEEHGSPWVYAREIETIDFQNGSVCAGGLRFHSRELRERLVRAEAHGAVIVGVGAGPELEEYARRLWSEEKPDEYFFMEIYGSAVVEHLTTMMGARLCEWAERRAMAVLPHYSPGYRGWDLADQPVLLNLARQEGDGRFPADLTMLPSGMLRPKKSQLALFGLTRRVDRVERLTDLVPCRRCSYAGCRYRREAYEPPDYRIEGTAKPVARTKTEEPRPPATPSAEYRFNLRALKRWSDKYLEVERNDKGEVEARFHFEGTTCSNYGLPLAFDYRVRLSPPEDRFRILEMQCIPVGGEANHEMMCGFLSDPDGMMTSIEEEKPLLGRPLDDVLHWNPETNPAGCLCERANRDHKWLAVFETLHYRLTQS